MIWSEVMVPINPNVLMGISAFGFILFFLRMKKQSAVRIGAGLPIEPVIARSEATWRSDSKSRPESFEGSHQARPREYEILRFAQDDPRGRIATSSRSRVMARNDTIINGL